MIAADLQRVLDELVGFRADTDLAAAYAGDLRPWCRTLGSIAQAIAHSGRTDLSGRALLDSVAAKCAEIAAAPGPHSGTSTLAMCAEIVGCIAAIERVYAEGSATLYGFVSELRFRAVDIASRAAFERTVRQQHRPEYLLSA